MCVLPTVRMCLCVYMRAYSNATSEAYPLSKIPAFIGINIANVSVSVIHVLYHSICPSAMFRR